MTQTLPAHLCRVCERPLTWDRIDRAPEGRPERKEVMRWVMVPLGFAVATLYGWGAVVLGVEVWAGAPGWIPNLLGAAVCAYGCVMMAWYSGRITAVWATTHSLPPGKPPGAGG